MRPRLQFYLRNQCIYSIWKVATCAWKVYPTHLTRNATESISGGEHQRSIGSDGSALTNPWPTGAGAIIYLDGYSTSPILFQKGVSPLSNNYTGELVGIQIGLEFLAETDTVKHKNIHILTDCQPAMRRAFWTELPRNKIEIIRDIKNNLSKIRERQNKIKVHWVPGPELSLGFWKQESQSPLCQKLGVPPYKRIKPPSKNRSPSTKNGSSGLQISS